MAGLSDELDLDLRLEVGRARLLQRVQRRDRVQRTWVLVAAAVLVGVGLAAGVGAQQSPGAVAARVTCYTAADLTAAHSTVQVPGGASTSALTTAEQRHLCDGAWREDGGPGRGSTTSVLAVALCRLADGSVAVFPIESGTKTPAQACDDLGLTEVA